MRRWAGVRSVRIALIPDSKGCGGGSGEAVFGDEDFNVHHFAVGLVGECQRNDAHATAIGGKGDGPICPVCPADGGCALRVGNRLQVLILNDNVDQLLVAGECDGFPDKSAHLQLNNASALIAGDRLQQIGVFALLVEVLPTEVCNTDALAFRHPGFPFEAGVFKILNDQVVVIFKGGNWLSKSVHAAILFKEIEKGIANRKSCFWKIATGKWVEDIEPFALFVQFPANGGQAYTLSGWLAGIKFKAGALEILNCQAILYKRLGDRISKEQLRVRNTAVIR